MKPGSGNGVMNIIYIMRNDVSGCGRVRSQCCTNRAGTHPSATDAGETQAYGAFLSTDADTTNRLVFPVDQHRRLLVEVPVLLTNRTGNDFATEAEDAEQQEVQLLAVHLFKGGERDHNGQVVDDRVLLTILARVTPGANCRRYQLPLFTGRKRGKAPCPANDSHAEASDFNGHGSPPPRMCFKETPLFAADGLERGFVFSAPVGRSQLGACFGDDDRLLGALGGGAIKPVPQPRQDVSGTDGTTMMAASSTKTGRGWIMPKSPY